MNAETRAPVPLGRMVVGNALILAAGYLGVGLLVEAIRRVYPSHGVLQLSFALDALPARVLALLGALEPLRDAYLAGRMGEMGLRLIFGLTALGVIFVLAASLGAATALLRASWRR